MDPRWLIGWLIAVIILPVAMKKLRCADALVGDLNKAMDIARRRNDHLKNYINKLRSKTVVEKQLVGMKATTTRGDKVKIMAAHYDDRSGEYNLLVRHDRSGCLETVVSDTLILNDPDSDEKPQ